MTLLPLSLREGFLSAVFLGLLGAADLPRPETAPESGRARVTGTVRKPVVTGFIEAESTIDHLLLHFSRDAAGSSHALISGLLEALPPEVEVTIALADSSEDSTLSFLMPGHPRLHQRIQTSESLSVWARDRLVAIRPDPAGPTMLLSPDAEDVCPLHLGDLSVSRRLGEDAEGLWQHEATGVRFEGGNLLFSNDLVLVGWNDALDIDFEEVGFEARGTLLLDATHALSKMLGSPVLAVGRKGLPHEHLDMFLTIAGKRKVLLGDPKIGARFLSRLESMDLDSEVLPAFDAWTIEGQLEMAPLYDSIERELRASGFEVHRLPILHGAEGGILTWNNALVERRNGKRRAYVPVYDLPHLDRVALECYEALGIQPVPIPARRLAEFGGTVRCATNVIGWHNAANEPEKR